MYAPYTDVTLGLAFDISSVPDVKCFCLGFIVADNNQNPSWGGYYNVGSGFLQDTIKRIRARGGQVICSFGGAAGKELALVSSDENSLFLKYRKVIDAYKFDSIDFDIEGRAVGDLKANHRRALAIGLLKNYKRGLYVSLTLPVSPQGLDADCLNIVKQTPCDMVNIMAMDYGSEKDMGKAACDAAFYVRKQTGKDIGVTVMCGKNDTGEVFTLDDARVLKSYAASNVWIKRLSIWSIERDRGVKGSLNESSQIEQKPYEFTRILL